MQSSSRTHSLSLSSAIRQWWRNWRGNRAGVTELENSSPDELRRIAQDVGVNSKELRALAGKWPSSADLLTRRMAALELDPLGIARAQPAVTNDLKRLCSLCVSKGRCAHDLAGDANNSEWEEYCPNTSTLKALTAQRAAQATDGKKG